MNGIKEVKSVKEPEKCCIHEYSIRYPSLTTFAEKTWKDRMSKYNEFDPNKQVNREEYVNEK